MSKFIKLKDSKIIIKKSVVFLYTKNEISERENKSLQYHQKQHYLRINLTKGLKDLFTEN